MNNSMELQEIKAILARDSSMKDVGGDMKCVGRCIAPEDERCWLVRYKNSYLVLFDLGNGNYSFVRAAEPSEVEIDPLS